MRKSFTTFVKKTPSTKGGSRGGRLGRSTTPKTYESKFVRHDFVQVGKQHSW